MSLLKELVKETAITTAHDIGGHAGHQTMVDRKRRGSSLFKGGPIRRPRNSVSSAYRMPESQIKSVPSLNRWNWRILGEMVGKPQFDASDVMSKLDAAEKRARDEQDTVPFGLEDEDGNIIKVYVKAEEADEFESALAAMLAGEDEDEDDENSGMEIAEVLFQLKDRFQIVDVEWPNIEGDPEEEQEVAGEPGAAGGAPGGAPGAEGPVPGGAEAEAGGAPAGGAPGGAPAGGAEGGIEGEPGAEGGLEGELGAEGGLEGGPGEMEPEAGPEGMLQQVIDTMKADAEARKADAEARQAEAKAREAEANANSAASKVKQEEQVLDMEQWEKDRKSQEDETSKLARLAKMKHQQAEDAETQLSQEEEERLAGHRPTSLSSNELLQKILQHLQSERR